MSKARDIADLGSNDVLETSSTGVDVTGTVTADGLTVDGTATTGINGSNYTYSGTNYEVHALVGTAGGGVRLGQDSVTRDSFIGTTGANHLDIVTYNGSAWGKRAKFHNNGDVALYEDTGTTAKMVWDASAESLGIGTDSPGSSVAFSGGVKLQTADSTSTGYSASGSGRLPNGTQLSTYNTAASSSSLSGIGMLNNGPGGASMGSYIGSLAASSGWGANIVFGSTSGSSSHAEKARINSSGQLLVSTTTGVATGSISNAQIETVAKANENCIATQVVTNAYTAYASSGITSTGGDHHLYGYMVNGSGSNVGSIRVNHNGVVYNTTSDQRLKENIQDTTHTVDINDIQVRQFDWKDGGNHERYGFIAQELETVYPEAVTRPDSDDEMMSVDYSKLVPLLVKEIQQLKARIETLENN